MLRGLPPAIFGGRSEGANRPPAADGGAAYTATQSGQRPVHWRTRLLLLRCCERKMYVSGHVVARLAQAYASTPPRASPSPPSPNAWRLGQRWLAPACPASPLRERLALFARTGHQTHTPTQHTHTHTHTLARCSRARQQQPTRFTARQRCSSTLAIPSPSFGEPPIPRTARSWAMTNTKSTHMQHRPPPPVACPSPPSPADLLLRRHATAESLPRRRGRAPFCLLDSSPARRHIRTHDKS